MSTSSTTSTFEQEARPYEQPSSAPSQVRDSVTSQNVTPSEWRTVCTFLFGDLIGMLSVLGFVYLGASLIGVGVTSQTYATGFLIFPAVLVCYAVVGLYQRRFTHPALEMQRIGTLTLLLGAVSGGTVYAATGNGTVALLLAAAGGLGAVILPICRSLFRIIFAQADWWGVPAVIVSSGESGEAILDTLNRWPEIGIKPVALLGDGPTDADVSVPIRGGEELAPYLARHFSIPYAILAMPGLTHTDRANLLSHYSKFFDHIFVVSDSAGAPALWTTGRSGDGLFGYGVRNVALRSGAQLVKRAMDIFGALVALLILAPLFAGIALAIRLDAPGAVFYRQERMGRQGRIVTILKFRTMYEDADQKLEEVLSQDPALRKEYEQYHKLQNDPRVTRIGRFLRRYSLDELPQLLNVLRGDMSLVGPRAYMPSELEQMNGLARAVLQSPPGITGLWQVSGRNRLSFADRVNLDVHYIQNWSLWLDLYLLIRTAPVVFSGDGAS